MKEPDLLEEQALFSQLIDTLSSEDNENVSAV